MSDTIAATEVHPVDLMVGDAIRKLRYLRGMSQMELANRIDLSFQQLQKYEVGENRISASRLYEVSKALQVKPGFFFEKKRAAMDELPVYADRQTAQLVTSFARITDPQKHKTILNLVRALADENA